MLQSVQCTFEKRGDVLRVWVEPLVSSAKEPPVAELVLSVKNIMYGSEVKGSHAVYSVDPCTSVCPASLPLPFLHPYSSSSTTNANRSHTTGSLEWSIERATFPQSDILKRRRRAYRRQQTIARSHPGAVADADVEIDEIDEEDAEVIASAITPTPREHERAPATDTVEGRVDDAELASPSSPSATSEGIAL